MPNRRSTGAGHSPPPLPPHPLEYDVIRRGGPAPVGLAILAGVCSGIVVLIFAVAMLFIIPQIEKVFRDYRVELPWISHLCLEIHRYLTILPSRFVLQAALCVIPVIVGGTVGAVNSARPERPYIGRRMIILVTWVLLLAMVVFFILSIFLPLIALIGSLSGGAKK